MARRSAIGVPPLRIVAAVLLLSLLPTATAVRRAAVARAAPTLSGSRPNIVLVLSDDQRFDALRGMTIVKHRLIGRGVRATNAFVVNPLCCPSRTSILTGAYSHTTGVYDNEGPTGPDAFDASDTIAVRLRNAGYRTALIGKYVNRFNSLDVPPGWSRFAAFSGPAGGVPYYDYTLAIDGVARNYGSARSDYSTSVLGRLALRFVSSSAQPFFLYLAPAAPHAPAIPADRDRHAFSRLRPWRPPSYDERDVSDKPAWLRSVRRLRPEERDAIDAFRVDQFRSLQAVDRMVGALVRRLRALGELRNTVIVYASDNGLFWGEHRLHGKNASYEESIRIPLVIRWDALPGGARTVQEPVLNIDLAPTFADAAGVSLPGAEGLSLLPLLEGSATSLRNRFLVEHANGRIPPSCAVRSTRFAYIRYATGEEELYDLRHDPWELDNVAGRARFADRLNRLRVALAELCDPPPPGYAGWIV